MTKGKRKADSGRDGGTASNKKKTMDGGGVQREDKLLACMMKNLLHGDEAVSFRRCSTELDFMERTTSMRNAWKALLDNEFIEPCTLGDAVYTSDHKLTQKGKDRGSTEEYREYFKDLNFVANNNDAHQERIKKKLINKIGVRIFDLLLEHGSLTRKELAGIVGVCDRGHSFSYAFQQLKKKLKIVEDDLASGKKGSVCLADSAFLPGKRPQNKRTDSGVISKLISNAPAKRIRKNKPTENKTTSSISDQNVIPTDESEGDSGDNRDDGHDIPVSSPGGKAESVPYEATDGARKKPVSP